MRVGHGDDTTIEESLRSKSATMIDDVKEDDFSIVDEHERGCFNIFFIHMWAMIKKRFFIYKRNYRGLLVEIFIPVILVLIGFAFSQI